MNKRLCIITLLIIILTASNSVLSEEMEQFYFHRYYNAGQGVITQYFIEEENNKARLKYSFQDQYGETLEPDKKESMVYDQSLITELMNLLEFINFKNIKPEIQNNISHGAHSSIDIYKLIYKKNSIIHEKKVRCRNLEFKASDQIEMIKLSMVNLFLESKHKYRNKNGTLKYWRYEYEEL